MSAIKTTYPTGYEIKPQNPILFGFESSVTSGGAVLCAAVISFWSALGSGTPFTALEGQYIEINGQRIYFSDNPDWTQLTSSVFSTAENSTFELFNILTNDVVLKNQYNFAVIDDGGGFYHVLMISKSYSINNNVTLSLSGGVSSLYTFSFPGQAGVIGGDTWNWGVYLILTAWYGTEKLMLNDLAAFDVVQPNSRIILEKNWQGFELDGNNNVIAQNQILFDVSGFLSAFFESINPFDILTSVGFTRSEKSLVRYTVEFGEYYATVKNGVARTRISEKINETTFVHVGLLSETENPFTIESTFEKYWERTGGLKIDWLTNQPSETLISVNQTVLGAFIYKYFPWVAEPYEDTQILLYYDITFVNGTTLIGNQDLTSLQTITYFTQYFINLSLNRLNYQLIESLAGSLIEKIEWYAVEANSLLIPRIVTNKISFTIDNELRDYRIKNELIWLNQLGGYDSLYLNNEIIESIETESSTYQKNIVYKPSGIKKGDTINNEVLEVQNIKNYVVNTDSLDRETFKYLGNDLLKSKKIYLNEKRVILNSSNFAESTENETFVLTLNFSDLLI